MKRYRVEFSAEAQEDIRQSFEWGRMEWGERAAIQWYKKLRTYTQKMLMIIPLAQPAAPEAAAIGRDIRQLIFRRYRILFEVEGKLVKVLHVKGAFVTSDRNDIGVDE